MQSMPLARLDLAYQIDRLNYGACHCQPAQEVRACVHESRVTVIVNRLTNMSRVMK